MGRATMAADPDALVISRRKTEKDLKVSEGMLIAGVAIYAISLALLYRTVGQSLSASGFLLYDILAGTAGVFIFIGAIFTGINWWLLRKSRPVTPT